MLLVYCSGVVCPFSEELSRFEFLTAGCLHQKLVFLLGMVKILSQTKPNILAHKSCIFHATIGWRRHSQPFCICFQEGLEKQIDVQTDPTRSTTSTSSDAFSSSRSSLAFAFARVVIVVVRVDLLSQVGLRRSGRERGGGLRRILGAQLEIQDRQFLKRAGQLCRAKLFRVSSPSIAACLEELRQKRITQVWLSHISTSKTCY